MLFLYEVQPIINFLIINNNELLVLLFQVMSKDMIPEEVPEPKKSHKKDNKIESKVENVELEIQQSSAAVQDPVTNGRLLIFYSKYALVRHSFLF